MSRACTTVFSESGTGARVPALVLRSSCRASRRSCEPTLLRRPTGVANQLSGGKHSQSRSHVPSAISERSACIALISSCSWSSTSLHPSRALPCPTACASARPRKRVHKVRRAAFGGGSEKSSMLIHSRSSCSSCSCAGGFALGGRGHGPWLASTSGTSGLGAEKPPSSASRLRKQTRVRHWSMVQLPCRGEDSTLPSPRPWAPDLFTPA